VAVAEEREQLELAGRERAVVGDTHAAAHRLLAVLGDVAVVLFVHATAVLAPLLPVLPARRHPVAKDS
jgi:hypothetical protein